MRISMVKGLPQRPSLGDQGLEVCSIGPLVPIALSSNRMRWASSRRDVECSGGGQPRVDRMRAQASRVSVRRCAAIEPRGSKRAESGFENHSVAQAARVSMTSSRPSARSAVSMRPTAVVWRGSSMRRTAFSSTPSRLARATRDRPLSRSARASAALAAVPAGTAT